MKHQQTHNNDIEKEFASVVNMTSKALEKWLASEESKSVGFTNEGEHEAVGHKSGKQIIKILDKKKADLTEDDIAHMHKVVGYIHRHLAQRPKGDVEETRWRYSLMNWGHDPLKA